MKRLMVVVRSIMILGVLGVAAPALSANSQPTGFNSTCVDLDEYGAPCTICVGESGCWGIACDNPDGGYDTDGGCPEDPT